MFSSRAAVYGTPYAELVTEDTPRTPSRPTASPSSSASGCCETRASHGGPAPHLAALLQRRRLGHPELTTRARTTSSPSSSRPSSRAAPRRSTAPTTRPRMARPCATTSTWPTSRSRTSPRRAPRRGGAGRARLQPRQRHGRRGRRDHGGRRRGHGHRLTRPYVSAPAAPATRPGSSPARDLAHADSTGRPLRHTLHRHGRHRREGLEPSRRREAPPASADPTPPDVITFQQARGAQTSSRPPAGAPRC